MVRRTRLFIATSLDGYIAGPGGALDWLFTDDGDGDGYGYDPFIAGVDTLAMGRRTYETVAGFGAWPYDGMAAWVFTRGTPPEDPRVRFTAETPREWCAARAVEAGRDIWIVGGGELVGGFLDAQLVDDVTIAVHPVLLGGGVPLIPPGTHRHALRLVASRQYRSGLVLLSYAVQR